MLFHRLTSIRTRLIEELEAQVADLQSSLHGHTLRAAEHHKLRAAAIEELTAELAAEKDKTRKLSKMLAPTTTTGRRTPHMVRWRSEDHGDHWALRLSDPLIRVHSNGAARSRVVNQQAKTILTRIWENVCCFWCLRRRRSSSEQPLPSVIGNSRS